MYYLHYYPEYKNIAQISVNKIRDVINVQSLITIENAVAGIEDNTLFVVRHCGKIAGSVILGHHSDGAYSNVKWKVDVDYSRIFSYAHL